MNNTTLQKYLQYSKRIAIFAILQWSVIAILSLILVMMSSGVHVIIDEWAARVINNVVTCASALSIAICSGYYAHSAYDNSLKKRVSHALMTENDEPPAEESGNG